MACTLGADNHFGPAVGEGCRDDFDFTLLFEQSFLQLAPCALLLLLVPIRASHLRKQKVKVLRNGMQTIKQAAILALAATQLALLIWWTVLPTHRTRASIPAAVVSFLTSLSLIYLSSIEHTRSVRPSSIINAFILFSLLFDLPQARTLWLRPGPRSLPAIFTAGVASKSVVLCLEACSKRSILFPPYRLYAPESLVSIYDRTVLWWLNPLFWTGYRSMLSMENLSTVDADLNPQYLESSFQRAWKKQPNTRRWALLWAILNTVKSTIFAMVIPRLCLSALKLSQPLLIARITTLLGGGLDTENSNGAKGLIGAAALLYIGIPIATALYQRQLHRMITMFRGIVVSAVYTKSMSLDSFKLADGPALTLISADINRITGSLRQIDDLFATPIEVAVAIYLLQRQIGVSAVAPVAFSIVISIVSFLNSNIAVPMQKRWLAAVSDRVAYISSVLGSPKGFKMLGLTDFLITHIQGMRIRELEEYAAYRKYVTWRNVFSYIPRSFAPSLTLMMFTLINGGQALDPTTAFATLALIALLTNPIQDLIHVVPMLQTALASLDRVQTFLRLDNDEEPVLLQEMAAPSMTNSSGEVANAFELSAVSAPKAQPNSTPILTIRKGAVVVGTNKKQVLTDLNIELRSNHLCMLVGPVGSGKSTVLKAVIGDIRLSTGERIADPSIVDFAYCAQEPWIPNETIRNLVLGASDFDQAWYDTVKSACALSPDIASFPAKDETLVGTRGVSLSGGQRQRLALARALYARKRMMIADDVLSGLDANTSRQIFTQVFGPRGLCKAQGMTVLLATHAQQYLREADHIIALEGGKILKQGDLESLDASGSYFHELGIKAIDSEQNHARDVPNVSSQAKGAVPDKAELAQQDLLRKTGDRSLYAYYLKSIGWKWGVIMFLANVGFAFGTKFPDLWVRWWSEAEVSGHPARSLSFWIGVLVAIAFVGCFSVGAQIWTMLVYAVPKSSAQLHKQLLDAVMHATYAFFVNTDAGITLNRFSNDMSLIETELAGAFMQFTAGAAVCLAATALIVAGADYAAITLPFVFGLLYGVQKFYLRTSRQLRFLDLETQAPLLAHCSETVAGVTTIRAFGWQHHCRQKCYQLLDASLRASYLLLCVQRWLTLVLGLVTAGLAVVVLSMALALPSTSSAGAVGVALLGILDFTGLLSMAVNAWTSLETSLGAVARCKNFEEDTPSEDRPAERSDPPTNWPDAGQVTFTDICASYHADTNDAEQNVLQHISLSIAAGEKIGICGRSGSGKSSLLLTLFRLLDLSSGRIEVDGVDLSTLPRQTIRARLAALPQEVVTFPGSLRANLDPLGHATVAEAESALRKVGLLDLVSSASSGIGGLDADLASLGLSQGQMQLFAVARALLLPPHQRSKLLVLDEMTSSLDPATEHTLHRLIRDEFPDSTVIAVAHRLRSIVAFDRIVVLDQGRVVELGSPADLLARRDPDRGFFRAMWERAG